jgi:hypothetical protein
MARNRSMPTNEKNSGCSGEGMPFRPKVFVFLYLGCMNSEFESEVKSII